MENNEMMVSNESILDLTEEVVTKNDKGLRIAGSVAAAIIVGGLAYKFVVKPLIAKFKAKKQEQEHYQGEVVGVVRDDIDD